MKGKIICFKIILFYVGFEIVIILSFLGKVFIFKDLVVDWCNLNRVMLELL